MTTRRHDILRCATLLGVGIGIGAAFSAHSASAQPLSPAPCTTTHKTPTHRTSTAKSTYVTDNQTGMSVQASALRHDPADFMGPPKGDVFAAVHVLVHNGGRTANTISGGDFTLHGQRDQTDYAVSFNDFTAHSLNVTTLRAGASIAGDVVFEVPKAVQHYTLQWTPEESTFSGPPLIIPMGR